MSTFVIEDIKLANRGKKFEPLKIKFSHCENPLKAEDSGIVKTGIFSDGLAENEYVAICQAGHMCYMGSTREQIVGGNHTSFIALRNKASNKVQLVEISKLLLSPIVRFPNSTNPLLLTRDEKDPKQSKEEMSREFVHRFGMLKGQRLYDQAERLTVKAETVRANLENAAVNTAVEENEFTLPKSSDSYEMVVPPRNSQAKLVSEVYLIKDIIPSNDMVALKEIALSLLSEEGSVEIDNSVEFSSYFTRELTSLKSNKSLDPKTKLQHTIALLYTESLIKLSTVKEKKLFVDVVNEKLPKIIPDQVKTSLRGKFTCKEGPSWIFNQMCRDKTICHLIALALIIGNYSIDGEVLSQSLKLDIDLLDPLIRVVGARVIKDKGMKGVSSIVLTLPLAQPPHKRIQGKKKENYNRS